MPKSTLSRKVNQLEARLGAIQIAIERTTLQTLGDSLDLETQYSWIAIDVALPQIQATPDQRLWIVDCVRKVEQIALCRKHFGSAVTHVHFTCPEFILKKRIADRVLDLQALSSENAACKVANWAHPPK